MELVAAALDRPRAHRVQRGGGDCLARAQAETCVMPRAMNGVAVDEAFGQRTAVMRGRRADGEGPVASPDQDDRLAAGMTEHRLALGDLGQDDALREIRS